MKSAQGLVRWARARLGSPYWYGADCEPCTERLLAKLAALYPKHYGAGRMERYRVDIVSGANASDCSGLIVGYLGGEDQSSGTLFARHTRSGVIDTLPEIPGLLLWRKGHIGVYEGHGYCIEARGFAYGTVRTRVADRDFTHWCQSSQLAYDGEQAEEQKAVYAVCGGKGVNIRTGAGIEHESLGQADKGDKLLAMSEEGEWRQVAAVLDGRIVCGWMHKDYVGEVTI